MNIKGEYSGLTTYDPGDIVRWADNTIYILRKPCKSGVPPTDTLYWERMQQPLADAVELMMDSISVAESGALTGKVANNLTTTASGKVLDARQGKALKTLIDDIGTELDLVYPDSKTLVLMSSTASSEKKFAITVNDSGELTATEITAEGES